MNKDIPDGSVAVGFPAKVIGQFNVFLEKRMTESLYPDKLKPKNENISSELADLLWKDFVDRRKSSQIN